MNKHEETLQQIQGNHESDDNHVSNSNSNPSPNSSTKQQSRQQFPSTRFWPLMLATICIAAQDLFSMFNSSITANIIIYSMVFVFSVCTLLYISWKTSKGLKDLICMTFLIDNIFVTLCAALVGYTAVMMQFIGFSEEQTTLMLLAIVFMYIQVILYSGTYRLCLSRLNWKRYQVLGAKFTFMFSMIIYLMIALIFMRMSQEVSELESVSEYFFLYVFGLFAFVLEIYAKLTDLDGSGDLSYKYQIVSSDESQEIQNVNLHANKQVNDEPKIVPANSSEVKKYKLRSVYFPSVQQIK